MKFTARPRLVGPRVAVAAKDGAAGVSKTPRVWVGAIVPVETLGVLVGAVISVETLRVSKALRVWVAEGAGVTGAAAQAAITIGRAIAPTPPKRWGQGRSHVTSMAAIIMLRIAGIGLAAPQRKWKTPRPLSSGCTSQPISMRRWPPSRPPYAPTRRRKPSRLTSFACGSGCRTMRLA